jgi:hypothetical protein
MQHTTVASSNIHSIGYDPATSELEVRFKNGGTYRYAGVDAETHAAFLRAPSVGAHFHQHIKSTFTGTPTGAS